MLSVVKNNEEEELEETKELELCPEPPEWMSYEAKCEWLRSAEDLFKKGRLVGGNISLFENYCIAIGYIRECADEISVEGKVVNGRPHPNLKIITDFMSQANSLAKELKFVRDGSQDGSDEDNWGKDKKLLA